MVARCPFFLVISNPTLPSWQAVGILAEILNGLFIMLGFLLSVLYRGIFAGLPVHRYASDFSNL